MLSRQSMLEFYATSGDFTRRLTSIKANSKFSSPLAGPEEYYSVRCRWQAKIGAPLAHQNQFPEASMYAVPSGNRLSS